jgi:hypothetical protein
MPWHVPTFVPAGQEVYPDMTSAVRNYREDLLGPANPQIGAEAGTGQLITTHLALIFNLFKAFFFTSWHIPGF